MTESTSTRGALRRDMIMGVVLLAFFLAAPFIFPSRYMIGQGLILFIWAVVVSQ